MIATFHLLFFTRFHITLYVSKLPPCALLSAIKNNLTTTIHGNESRCASLRCKARLVWAKETRKRGNHLSRNYAFIFMQWCAFWSPRNCQCFSTSAQENSDPADYWPRNATIYIYASNNYWPTNAISILRVQSANKLAVEKKSFPIFLQWLLYIFLPIKVYIAILIIKKKILNSDHGINNLRSDFSFQIKKNFYTLRE